MPTSTPIERLRHEVARDAAHALADVIVSILGPEERIEFRREAYALVRAALDAYELEKSKLD